MEFELNQTQLSIKKAAREFAEKEFKPEIGREYDKKSQFPWELYRKAAKLGFIGIGIPEEYGGQGLGVLEEAIVREEFHRVDSTLGVITAGAYGSDLIEAYGTKEQKEKYLPRICKGEILSAMALTEPEHGTDAGTVGLNTTAVKDGSEYVINGTKTFISNGDIAEFVIVCCQTDPKATPPYRGISQIIVEKGTPGFEARKLDPKMGYNALHHAELSFDNVRVPVENLLGQENRGFYQVLSHLNKARIDVASWGVGLAQGAFEKSLLYSKNRTQFGQSIAKFQMIQLKIAEMAMKVEAARLLTYKSAWLFDRKAEGRLINKWAAIAKAYATKVALEVTDDAIQIHGGYGYVDSHIERYYRDGRAYNIIEGTGEILRYIIARQCYSEIGLEL